MSNEIKCTTCDWRGVEEDLHQENMLIVYRPVEDAFRTFVKMKCPNCNDVFTILVAVAEVIDGDLKTKLSDERRSY